MAGILVCRMQFCSLFSRGEKSESCRDEADDAAEDNMPHQHETSPCNNESADYGAKTEYGIQDRERANSAVKGLGDKKRERDAEIVRERADGREHDKADP